MNKSYILVLTIIGLIVVSILSLEISPTAWATAKKEKNLHVPVNVFANTNVEAWTEDGKIVARLTMDNGSPISNEELRFHLGDKIVKAKTDEDGIASAVFTDYAGQVTIEFSGDKEKYLNPSKTEIEVSSETLLLKNILPPEARNIVVKENGKIVNHFSNVKYADLTINLKRKSRGFSVTGFATGKSSVKNGMEIKKRQHKVILFQPVKWSLEVGDYTIEYETPEPTAKEIQMNGKKRIIIKSNATDHYYNVSAFTTLPELDYKPRLYRIVSGKRIDVSDNPVYNVSYWDTNGNGLYDKITWIVPMLSNDTYEVDLTILNVHSYPPIGGNWTVQFTTQGTADLWIRPVNGTTWSLTGKDTDLQFLDIRCGNTSVSYRWINDSVYVPNWSCSGVGEEISKEVDFGHHTLEFRFGDVVKYAYNEVTFTRDCQAGTFRCLGGFCEQSSECTPSCTSPSCPSVENAKKIGSNCISRPFGSCNCISNKCMSTIGSYCSVSGVCTYECISGYYYDPSSDSCVEDTEGPTVNVIGDPSNWTTTATADISCDDHDQTGCNASTYRLKTYSSNPGSCPQDYSQYTLTAPRTITSHVWVCGAAKDNASNAGFSSPVEFKVDSTKPSTSITSPDAGSWHGSDFSVTFSDSDTGGSGLSKCYYRILDNGVQSYPSSGWAERTCNGQITVDISQYCTTEGENTCTVESNVTDNAGNSANVASTSFSIDITPPSVSATPTPSDWRSNIIITLHVSDDLSGVKISKYSWDNSNCWGGKDFTDGQQIQPDEGTHTLYLCAEDNVDNQNTWSYTYKIDKTPPSVSFISPTPSDGAFIGGVKRIKINASDSLSGLANITFYVDGQLNHTCPYTDAGSGESRVCDFQWDTSGLSDGQHTVYAKACDNLGHCNQTEQRTYTIFWLEGWNFRKPIVIDNTHNSQPLTDFQVNVTVDTESLISVGKMQDDCDDIRFTWWNATAEREEEIPYWIESGCGDTSTVIWVKVPEIPANNITRVWMYYGNTSAPGKSNESIIVHHFVDEFNNENYIQNKDNMNVTNGQVTLNQIVGWIYQEDADSYSCSGSWDSSHPCSNTHDGNWSTYGAGNFLSGGDGYVYMNYIKPSGFLDVKWQVKDYNISNEPVTLNLSLPSECKSQSPLQLEAYLKSQSSHIPGEGTVYIFYNYWKCYNGTGWETLRGGTNTCGKIYEEAIWWKMPLNGSLTSKNLLYSEPIVSEISNFSYNLPSLPSDAVAKVQFSKDNVHWYSSDGTPNGWNTMSQGVHTIDLSGLGWSGSSFYYRIYMESNGESSPVLDWINLTYWVKKTTTPEPTSAPGEEESYYLTSVAFTPPTADNGRAVSGIQTINVTASSQYGIEDITIYLYTSHNLYKKEFCPSSGQTPAHCNLSWDTRSFSLGETLYFNATTYDSVTNFAKTETRTVYVDNQAPSVSITSPSADEWIRGTTTINITASDSPAGLERIEIWIDKNINTHNCTYKGNSSVTCTWDWDTTKWDDGQHKILAGAFDYAYQTENRDSNEITVYVDNTEPSTCSVESIEESSAYSYVSGKTIWYNNANSGSFTVTVNAVDDLSGISKVEFPTTTSAGSTDYSSPYSHTYNWDTSDVYSDTATVRCYDKAGNYATDIFNVKLDTTPPSGGSISYPDGYTTSVTLTLDPGSDNTGGSGLNLSKDRIDRYVAPLSEGGCGSFSYNTSFYPTGTTFTDSDLESGHCYKYEYVVYDNVNNAVTYTNANVVKVDTQLPTVNLVSPTPEPNSWVRDTVTIKADASDSLSNISKIEIYVDANLLCSQTFTESSESLSCNWNTNEYSDGSHTVKAKAYDFAGNINEDSRTINVDNTLPNITYVTLSDYDVQPGTTITIATDGSDSPSGVNTCHAYLDDDTNYENGYLQDFGDLGTDCNGTVTLPSVSDGIYYIIVRPVDKAGNANWKASDPLKIDSTPPSCSIESIKEVSGNAYSYVTGTTIYYNNASSGSFMVNVSTSDNLAGIDRVVFPDATSSGTTDYTSPYNHTYTWSVGSSYSGAATVTCYDKAGNSNTTTFEVVLDNTPPSGGSITYADGYYTTKSVSISYSLGSDSGSGINASRGRIERRSAPLSGGVCGSWSDWSTIATESDGSYTDSDVQDDTCYQYRYVIYDNVNNSAVYNSTNVVKVDTIGPSISYIEPPTESDGSIIHEPFIEVEVLANDNGAGLKNITIYLYRADTQAGPYVLNKTNTTYYSGETSTTLLVNFTGLSDGYYKFNATVFDQSGNQKSTETRSVTLSIQPTTFTDLSYSCEDDCGWGEQWNFSAKMWDDDTGQSINVTLWLERNGTWTKVAGPQTKPAGGPDNPVSVTFTVDPAWLPEDAGQQRCFKFEAIDNWHAHYNSSESCVDVNPDNISIDVIEGNNGVVSRDPNSGYHTVTFKVNVTDLDNSEYVLDGEPVNFWVYYDGAWHLVGTNTTVNGIASISWSPDCNVEIDTTNNPHDWKVNHTQSSTYKLAESNVYSVTVRDTLKPIIDFPGEGSILYRGYTYYLTSTINDTCGHAIPGGYNAYWYNGSWDQILGSEDGYWTVPSNYKLGTETIHLNATANLNPYYDTGTTSVTVEIYGYAKVLNLTVVGNVTGGNDIIRGESAKVTCEVEDNLTGERIANYTVNFEVRNSTGLIAEGSANTTADGVATWYWDTSNFGSGLYNITCSIGDEPSLFYGASSENTLRKEVNLIDKLILTLTTDNEWIFRNDSYTPHEAKIIAKVTRSFIEDVANEVVNFYENGVSIGQCTTNSSGECYVVYNANDMESPQDHEIYANTTYVSDPSFKANNTIEIRSKGVLNIKLNEPEAGNTFYKTQTMNFNATAEDEYGNSILNANVSFYINDQNVVNATTSSIGHWTIPSDFNPGSVTVKVVGSHAFYEGVSGSNEEQVLIQIRGYSRPSISLNQSGVVYPPNTEFIQSKHIDVYCNVTDANSSQPLSGYKVEFWVDDQNPENSTTNANGVANFIWWPPANVGYYTLRCRISNDEVKLYDASPNEANVTIHVGDTTPPTINSFDAIGPNPLEANHQRITITANVSDNVVVDKVWIIVNSSLENEVEFLDRIEGTQKEGIYQRNFTPRYGGDYNITLCANDTSNNTICSEDIKTFKVIGKATGSLYRSPESVTAEDITRDHPYSFVLNVTLNNTGSEDNVYENGTMYNAVLNLGLPDGFYANETNKTCGNIPVGDSCRWSPRIYVTNVAPLGTSTVTISASWKHPNNNTPTPKSATTNVNVLENPYLDVSPQTKIATIGHGETSTFEVNFTSYGNTHLYHINSTCTSSPSSDLSCDLLTLPYIYDLLPNETKQKEIKIDIPLGTAPTYGNYYIWSVLANTTYTENKPCNSSECQKTIDIYINVPEDKRWNLTPRNLNVNVSINEINITYINLTNLGNVDRNWTIIKNVGTNCVAHNIGINVNSSVYVPKVSSALIPVVIDATTSGGGDCTLVLNFTNLTADPQSLTSIINIHAINPPPSITISVLPYDHIDLGKEIANISYTVRDNSLVKQMGINVTKPDGTEKVLVPLKDISQKEYSDSSIFTETDEVGTYLVKVYAEDDAGQWSVKTTEFYVGNETDLDILLNQSTITLNNITYVNGQKFQINVSVNNTERFGAYDVNVTVSASDQFNVQPPVANLGKIKVPTLKSQIFNITALPGTSQGSYTLRFRVSWKNPSGSTESKTKDLYVKVNPTRILRLTTDEQTYTIQHGTKRKVNVTLNSTGNAKISNIHLNCEGVGSVNYCTQFDVKISPSLTSLSAGQVKKANVSISIPFTYPPSNSGTYTFKVVANSSDISPVELPISVFVPVNTSWDISPTSFDFTTGSGSYGYLYVNVTSEANVNLTFQTSNTNPNITAHEDSFQLPKGQIHKLRIDYETPELNQGEEERNITGNITISCTDCGTSQSEVWSRTIPVRMRVLPFKVFIENVTPTKDIIAGEEMEAIVNVTFAGEIITNSSLVSFDVYVGDKRPDKITIEHYGNDSWLLRFKAPDVPDGKNYTLKVEAIHLLYSARTPAYYENINYKDVTPPSIIDVKTKMISPGEKEEIFVNISDNVRINNAWLVVQFNNTQIGPFNLTNLTGNFVNSTWYWSNSSFTSPGDYDVIIYANDTTGNVRNITTWFRVNQKVRIVGVVKDVNDNPVPTKFEVYRNGKANVKTYLASVVENKTGGYNIVIPKGKYDIKLEALGHEITFRDVDVETNLTNITRVSDVDLSIVTPQLPLEQGTVLKAFAIDHRNLSFSSSDIIINFSSPNIIPGDLGLKNIEVYKCKNWDFDNQTCEGSWEKVSNINVDVTNLLVTISNTDLCAFVLVKPAVTPSTTPPTQPSTRGGYVGNIREELQKLLNRTQVPPLSAETDLIEATLHPGESKMYSLYLSNNLDREVTASIKIVGSVWEFIQLEKDQVTIPSGGSESIGLKVFTLPTTKPGVYTGDIVISTVQYSRTIPVTIMVVPPEEPLLDVKVQAITKMVPINGTLKYYVTIYNMGTRKRFDIHLTYRIKSAFTEEVLDHQEEEKAITSSMSFIKAYDLSHVKDVIPGKYFIEVIATYGNNKTASSVDVFEVVKPFWTKDRIIMVAIAIIAVASLIAGWKGKKYYDKWKMKRMRYLHPVDLKSLPRGDIWLGKIAEMNVRAEFNMDDLTTHIITAGATGSGKSVSAMVIVEEVLKQGIPVVVFDPTAQWTGFVKPCRDKKMLSFYKKFGMVEDEARPFKGMIYEVTDPNVKIDLRKYMNPGEITVFTLNKLTPSQFDQAVRNIIDTIFRQGWEESNTLKLVVVFDEVHRLLEKFGGKGGYVALEKACREFRKWGIGLIMISQVLADFKEAIKGNVLTEIQMHTKSLADIDRIEKKYGKVYAERVIRLEVGVGMIQNPKYNRGRPYFVNFRPLLHSPHKLRDAELELYLKYSKEIDKIEEKIKEMKKKGMDTSDLELDLKLAKDKLKIGAFRMAEIYLETLRERLK